MASLQMLQELVSLCGKAIHSLHEEDIRRQYTCGLYGEQEVILAFQEGDAPLPSLLTSQPECNDAQLLQLSCIAWR